ncbi:hypothetical protein DFP98_11068 [Cohnella phaseoli]|uniref:Uncharacterized protein n=1 Tax=Cohnella phaseoli TaxID=456490 RepID=A0A3D9JSU2_9BACL|nr:hypothetical protein DFP98_11068 [Cohnella phaseoli]
MNLVLRLVAYHKKGEISLKNGLMALGYDLTLLTFFCSFR